MTDSRAPQKTMSRASIAVAAFSTVVEWYDFTLYLYFATVLSRVFFGDGGAALSTTLAAFAIAYLLRPLGGFVFGHIGDRFGRRRTMLLSVALMTLTMLGTALLPTHAQAGAAAGWLLFHPSLRHGIFGRRRVHRSRRLSAGRLGPADRRGLITSLASASSEIGGLLAVGVSLADRQFDERRKLGLVGMANPFSRRRGSGGKRGNCPHDDGRIAGIRTTEDKRDGSRKPAALRAQPTHGAGVLRSFTISALGSITYYVGITYVPTFLTSAGKLNESGALRLSTIAAVAVILVTPLVGALSDRIGRKPVLIALSLLSAILPITLFYLMAGGSASIRSLGGCDSRLRRWRGQRRRRHRDRRTIPGRRSHQWSGAGGDHGHRHLRRSHPLCRSGPDGTNRLDHGPRRDDRRGGRLGASDHDDFAGDGARARVAERSSQLG